jgi:hypothetical protein
MAKPTKRRSILDILRDYKEKQSARNDYVGDSD